MISTRTDGRCFDAIAAPEGVNTLVQMDSMKSAIFIDTVQLNRIIAVDGVEKFESQNSVDKG
jgi:hypothetical protein